MTAAKSRRWGCQFCGLCAEQDEKPVPGACAEREGAAHSWMNATILEGDPDVLAELQRKVKAREELVAATVGEAFGEKLRDTDVSEAQALVRRLQVEGDGLQTALLEVAKRGAAEAGARSVLDRMCWRCGWPQPIAGGTCLAGVGHHAAGDARSWWTPDEHAAKKDELQRRREVLAHQIGEANLEAGLTMLLEGKSWDAVRAALPKPEPAAEGVAAVHDPDVDQGDPPLPLVVGLPTAAEVIAAEQPGAIVFGVVGDVPAAPRKRGRPPKNRDASAVVAAPPAPRPSPARSAEPAPEPSRIGASEPADEDAEVSDDLWVAREVVRKVLAVIEAVEDLKRFQAGARGGHVLDEALDELHRRLGYAERQLRKVAANEAAGKAAAE